MVNRVGRENSSKDAGRRSGFVYKPRTAESVKARAERTGGSFDSMFKSTVDQYRIKEGDSAVRICPPTWDSEDNHYAYKIFRHAGIGPDRSSYLCPKKMGVGPCPICDASVDARRDGDEEESKQLAPKEGFVCWVVDRDDKADPPIPKLWTMSWTQDRDIAAQSSNPRSGKIVLIEDPDNGYDLTIKRVGKDIKTKYTFIIDRESTPLCEDERDQDELLDYMIANPIEDLLNFYDSAYLANVINGTAPAKDADLDRQDDDRDTRSRGRDDDRGSRGRDRGEEREARPSRRGASEEPEKSNDHDHEDAEARQYFRRERGGDKDQPAEREARTPRRDDVEREPRRSRRDDDARSARDREDNVDPETDPVEDDEPPFKKDEEPAPRRERATRETRETREPREERTARSSREPDPKDEEEPPRGRAGRETRPTRRDRR